MRVRGLLLAMALVGCGDVGAVRSSPLLAMDSDRLWVLLQAAKVNPRCRDLYAGSTDPRITGLTEKCAEAERRVVAWLEANGVADVPADDLREPAFWQWYSEKWKGIDACRAPLDPNSRSYWTDFNSCDPYERITLVEKRNLSDAGYREPGS